MHLDFVELIVRFGPGGNGFDRVVRRLGQRNLEVHCGSGINDVQLSWFFSNQTEVSYTDRYLRQGKNEDGISLLQIGNGRPINSCDAGVYTCKAELVLGSGAGIQQSYRNFTLLVGCKCTSHK